MVHLYLHSQLISHLAVKTQVVRRTVECPPFMTFFMWTPQCALTVTIKLLFNWKAKQVSAERMAVATKQKAWKANYDFHILQNLTLVNRPLK